MATGMLFCARAFAAHYTFPIAVRYRVFSVTIAGSGNMNLIGSQRGINADAAFLEQHRG